MGGESWTGGSERANERGRATEPLNLDETDLDLPLESEDRGAAIPAASDAPEQQLTRSLDQLQRLQAEFDNYRKRTVREREEWQQRAQGDLVKRLLPVLDDLDRAKSHVTPSEAVGALGGLLLILKRLEEALAAAGLRRGEDLPGVAFDPTRHEAIQAVPSSEIEEGHVVGVFDAGYSFNGQVLRPSKVSVSAGKGD